MAAPVPAAPVPPAPVPLHYLKHAAGGLDIERKGLKLQEQQAQH